MATIKRWLIDAGFDPQTGRILLQSAGGEVFTPGMDRNRAEFVGLDHPAIVMEFRSWFGAPEAPTFIAEDDQKVYFPAQCNGRTTLCVVSKNIERYMDVSQETPYP